MKFILFFVFALGALLANSCGEGKDETAKDNTGKDTLPAYQTITEDEIPENSYLRNDTLFVFNEDSLAAFDCEEYKNEYIETLYEGLVTEAKIDSQAAMDYSICLVEKIIDKYSCEQIWKLKSYSDDALREFYKPLKDSCAKEVFRALNTGGLQGEIIE